MSSLSPQTDTGSSPEGQDLITYVLQQDAHLHTIIEVLQSIKASEMSPLLKSLYASEGGAEYLDVLMKYMYVVLTKIPRSVLKSP
jgi:actin related protein 2/3 complex subunit 5